MKTYEQILEKLKKIKVLGYVKTHRKGPTGIGKTLEDLLGIPENNFAGPDGELVELKSERKNAKSMVTLFTKAPLPPKVNTVLVNRFGYITSLSRGRKILHSTVDALNYNTIKEKAGFKTKVNTDLKRVELLYGSEAVCYWDRTTLKNAFEKKLPRLLYVKAESKGRGIDEEFLFDEAWLLSGFDFENFVRLINQGKIKVDVRIGQNPDGSGHDHGTGFRVFPISFELCFSQREQVI